MVDPRNGEKRNVSAPFRGIVIMFIVVMVALAAYGYATHEWQAPQAPVAQQSDKAPPAKE
jgi:hypothetical protein